MLRAAGWILASLAFASGIGFLSLFLGGYAWALAHERLGLVPLIAGAGAASLHGCRRGHLSPGLTAAAMGILALWALFLSR